MASSDNFRKEVQGSVHKLLSGHKNKPPAKLVAEGVVEGFRLYRSYKEEKAKEGKEPHQPRRHRSRRDSSTEGHHDGSQRKSHRKHCDRSRERQREQSMSIDYGQGEERGAVPDPVIERLVGEARGYMVNGGLGRPDDRNPPYRSYSHDRRRTPSAVSRQPRAPGTPQHSHGRSRSHRQNTNLPPSHTGASQYPIRRTGPDGTQFGDLPKFKLTNGMALGIGNHVLNTYKHIKAEHDAGHRPKGMLEKKIDEIRGKKVNVRDVAVSQYRNHRKVRKERSGRDEERKRRGGGRRGDRSVQEFQEVLEGSGLSGPRKNQDTPRGARKSSPSTPGLNHTLPTDPSSPSQTIEALPETIREQPHAAPTQRRPSSLWKELGCRRLSVESYDSYTPRETSGNVAVEAASSYDSSLQQSDSTEVSPLRSSFEQPASPAHPTSRELAAPLHPPPPPPAAAPQQHAPLVNALLGAIKGGLKLKKVDKSEIKDNSEAKAGRPLYEPTPHSHDVEELERAQEGGWSTDDDAGPRSYTAPNRGFQDELARKLGGELP